MEYSDLEDSAKTRRQKLATLAATDLLGNCNSWFHPFLGMIFVYCCPGARTFAQKIFFRKSGQDW
jgi:hypothetical protein